MTTRSTAEHMRLIMFLCKLGICDRLHVMFTDVAPFLWDPNANGGYGLELPHEEDLMLEITRK